MEYIRKSTLCSVAGLLGLAQAAANLISGTACLPSAKIGLLPNAEETAEPSGFE